MSVLVPLDDPEHALRRDHLRPISAGDRPALLRKQLINALCRLRPTSTESSGYMWNTPNSVLVCNEHVIALPSEAIWLVEVFDMTLNPFRPTGTVVAQQRQVTGALLCHQNIAIGQHQEPARICKAGRKQSCGEAFRHAWRLTCVRHEERPIGGDRPCFRRGQIIGIDLKAAADLMLSRKI